MNDFLWDCALDMESNENFNNNDDSNSSHYCELTLNISRMSRQHAGVVIINESKGFGVFDTIGGALWEAALLLCAHILRNISTFRHVDILELGSGVGLPGLLLILVRQLLDDNSNQLTFSDYDPFVITVLKNTILQQFMERSDADGFPCQSVKLVNLDWKLFATICEDSDLECDWVDDESHRNNSQVVLSPGVDNSNFDMLMGSALCYTTDHVCLADLIKYYLAGRCNSVVVCQIGDRQGFTLLLERLAELDVWHEVQPVCDETYHVAQRIRRCTSLSSTDSVEGVQLRTSYYDFSQCSPLFGEPSNGSNDGSSEEEEWRSELLTTPRSAFVLLTARKGSHREQQNAANQGK